LIESIEFLLK